MSRMVSRWVSGIQGAEIQGYMDSKGRIKYSLIKLDRNRGLLTPDQKDALVGSDMYKVVFDHEEEAKEEFDLLGFLPEW